MAHGLSLPGPATRSKAFFFAGLIAAALLLGAVAPAGAATVTGKLSKNGYTVVAISTGGKSASAKAKRGAYKLKVPGRIFTLHLLDKRGHYAGPVVVGGSRTKAIVGVKTGAKLGKVRVRDGYATPVKPLAGRFIARSRTAKAKRGVPVGARGYGLVSGARGSAASRFQAALHGSARAFDAGKAGTDSDGDGVPAALDIDANANGVIDAVDPTAPRPAGFGVFSQLVLDLDQSVNANAGGVTPEKIDQAMADNLTLVFTNVQAGTELDCQNLSYCSAGGSGRVQKPPEEGGGGEAFPSCCDSDSDGMGTISGGSQGPSGAEFRLTPHATGEQIHSGDLMTEVSGGDRFLGSLGFVFKTVPAVKQLTDSGGAALTFVYPVAAGSVGTRTNPIVLPTTSSGPMTFTIWRPQRRPIKGAGEGRSPIDIGLLDYQVQLPNAPGAPMPMPGSVNAPQCPQSAFATTDPNLTATGGALGAMRDARGDAPADAAQTLTFSLDLGACITARGGSVTSGSSFHLAISAVSQSGNSVDHADQVIYFRFS